MTTFLAVLLVAAAAAYVVCSRDDAWLDEHREPDEGFDIEDYRDRDEMKF